MPIKDQNGWNTFYNANKHHPYIIRVLTEVFAELDRDNHFHPNGLLDKYELSGLAMMGVAKLIYALHSRGEEFRVKWNLANQLKNEGEIANARKGSFVDITTFVR
jgi:hypothetical protein